MAERIQRRRTRGWRMPEGAVYIGRPTRYGNPFRVGGLIRDPGYSGGPACPYDDGVLPVGRYYGFEVRKVASAADAVALFRAYVRFHDDVWDPEILRALLGGRDLACWCAPGTPCHGDVLLELLAR